MSTSRGAEDGAPFEPRPVHQRYLLAVLEAVDGDGNISDRAMAKRLNVRHESISRWRRWQPAFRAWVADQVERAAGERGSAVLARCAALAIRGSADHAKLYFTVTGRIGGDDRQVAPVLQVTVIGVAGPSAGQTWPGGYHPSIGPDDPLRTGLKVGR